MSEQNIEDDDPLYAMCSCYLRLHKQEYDVIKEMLQYSNNLYNKGLYEVRQHFFKTDDQISYGTICKIGKTNENYKLLQAGVAQQTLKDVTAAFKSFMELDKKAKNGTYDPDKVHIPHYRTKGRLYQIKLQSNAIAIHNGKLKLPVSRTYRSTHKDYTDIFITMPDYIIGKHLKEIRIIPVYNGQVFKIEYVYIREEQLKQLDKRRIMSIDTGVDNLLTCATDDHSFIIDGRRIKSINQWYNKEKARLSGIVDTIMNDGKHHSSRHIRAVTDKRNRRIRDIMLKSARYIVDYCITHNIGTVVIGVNKGIKQTVSMGKKNNQTFVGIPYFKLRNQLKHLCRVYGIDYFEQEESYTSKASWIDGDNIPVYSKVKTDPTFSGKRIKRGLYKSADDTLINADVNGALNIREKFTRKRRGDEVNYNVARPCSGLLANPERICIV